MNLRHFAALVAAASLPVLGACKDGSGPAQIGPPSTLTLVNAVAPTALANTVLPTAIQIVVKDASGHVVPNAIVSFSVTAGGGTLSKLADTSDANGVVEVTGWKLGKSHVLQTVTASVGTITQDVTANVQSLYKIEVRFFGPTMSDAQKSLFTNAAARLEGIVVADVIDANAAGQNFDLATSCNVSGQPPFNELVDDVIIYASIRDIDGPGKILAQAGPCLERPTGPNNTLPMPAVGEMQFDAADIDNLAGAGSLQEVITHEMLHVLGFGVLWENRGFVSGSGTSDPRYTGGQGRQGCVDVGGSVTCALSVPLENTGGPGTVESHWREATFNNEMMTGFIDQSPNPISKMTIGSLADLGYGVNTVDFDSYQIFVAALRAPGAYVVNHAGWERRPVHGVYQLANGRVTLARMK